MKDLLNDYLGMKIFISSENRGCKLFVVEENYFGVSFSVGTFENQVPVKKYIPYTSILAIHKMPNSLMVEIKTAFDPDNFLNELISRL